MASPDALTPEREERERGRGSKDVTFLAQKVRPKDSAL